MDLLRIIALVVAFEGAPTKESVQLPTSMSDGSKISIAPLPVPTKSEPDRRPVYVGLGLLVLAIAFYLNRRSRDRFETDRDERRDADDLHAAAAEPDEEKHDER